MRPKMHIRAITEQRKYLVEQMQCIEPVIVLLKDAIEKSKAWLEDKEGNLSTSYSEISQQLDQANVALLNTASEIMDESTDGELAEKSPSFPRYEAELNSLLETTQSFSEQIVNSTSQYNQMINRVDKTEEELSSLRELIGKFMEKQNKMEKDISDSNNNQVENYKILKTKQVKISKNNTDVNIRLNSQEKLLEEVNKTIGEIKSSEKQRIFDLYEIKKELCENKKWASDLKKHVNLLTTNVYGRDLSIQDFSTQDQNNSIMELLKKTREDFRKMEEKTTKSADNFRTKCEDLDKKISGQSKSLNTKMDDLLNKIQVIGLLTRKVFGRDLSIQELTTRDKTDCLMVLLEKTKENVRKMEEQNTKSDDNFQMKCLDLEKKISDQSKSISTDIQQLSNTVKGVELHVYKRYACQIYLINNTKVTNGLIISKFYGVHEYNGNHFNRQTGKFVSPEDGLYLVSVTLHEIQDKYIKVSVYVGDALKLDTSVSSVYSSVAGSAVVAVKKGQELCFKVTGADKDAMLSQDSGFSIVNLNTAPADRTCTLSSLATGASTTHPAKRMYGLLTEGSIKLMVAKPNARADEAQ